ncbi:MAG TPA: chemotaxis protein CheB, partial [Polyangiales bacterium]|nr:chemotaxis protein CheB [Polyangiales bacterium]
MIRVVVVDDSAFARKVLRECLQTNPLIEIVGTARDGVEALELITQLQPDVVTLDLIMPNLDGVGVLRALSEQNRRKVLIVSMADANSDVAIEALTLGAFDLVHKPTALALESLREISAELVDKVQRAYEASASVRTPSVATKPAATKPRLAASRVEVIVIGTSTGGPQALSRLLRTLPADLSVPVLVVIHIPPGYTAALAERLDAECAVKVVEASPGLRASPGTVVIARAGSHLKLVNEAATLRLRLDTEPSDTLHCPAVDVLFQSAASVCGAYTLGVVLTGMGN